MIDPVALLLMLIAAEVSGDKRGARRIELLWRLGNARWRRRMAVDAKTD